MGILRITRRFTSSQRKALLFMKIGYIGLGIMGKSMARNIMKAGFPLVVHNRSRAAVDELVAEGAQAAGSPAEVAAQVDVVFTNLPDSPDVELVVLGVGWHHRKRSTGIDLCR
jgi:3-hydroxyisobutyrate dehydrogenase-like beta-hydroxyacid dehydrogenase